MYHVMDESKTASEKPQIWFEFFPAILMIEMVQIMIFFIIFWSGDYGEIFRISRWKHAFHYKKYRPPPDAHSKLADSWWNIACRDPFVPSAASPMLISHESPVLPATGQYLIIHSQTFILFVGESRGADQKPDKIDKPHLW